MNFYDRLLFSCLLIGEQSIFVKITLEFYLVIVYCWVTGKKIV